MISLLWDVNNAERPILNIMRKFNIGVPVLKKVTLLITTKLILLQHAIDHANHARLRDALHVRLNGSKILYK